MDHEALVRDFFLGFIRLHVLYHAGKEPVCGVDLMAELQHHGYHISPGSMYPLLHQLNRAGYLTCEPHVVAGRNRKYYRLTPRGAEALQVARERLSELAGEVVADRRPSLRGDGAAPRAGRPPAGQRPPRGGER